MYSGWIFQCVVHKIRASSSANFKLDVSRKYLNEWMQSDDMVEFWREETQIESFLEGKW